MKHIAISIALFALHSALCTRAAAVPETWDVDLSAQPPQVFTLQRPRGETYELEVVLKNHGKPFAPAITNACIYWQTNGMENLYWSAPASVSNNVLKAYWLPEMDPGASTVRGFIGDPGHIYAAAFTFRFLSSPGATPNALPLPTPVIDFAKVRVLNPPWGGGVVDTNAVIDIIHKTVDGAARPLPKYLHELSFDDTYPEAAEEYYRSRGDGKVDGGCSAVRSGGYLYRNFDFPFDDRAEFVVRMSAGPNRFASVGVAQVGTNLTEQIVTSGKPSRCYKWLPGATVDGINENGVACEINVSDDVPSWHSTGSLHPLGVVRWILDHATNALHGAEYVAANVRFPAGWVQNFHYMVADREKTYLVENGEVYDFDDYHESDEPAVMTNFPLNRFPWNGMGMERFGLLLRGESITNAWYTRAYRRETTPPWVSEFPAAVLARTNEIFNAWASRPREYFRGKTNGGEPWWQTVHTSIYDITNRTLRIAVQEQQDDWYVFALSRSGTDEGRVLSLIDSSVGGTNAVKAAVAAVPGKLDSYSHDGNHRIYWSPEYGDELLLDGDLVPNRVHAESATVFDYLRIGSLDTDHIYISDGDVGIWRRDGSSEHLSQKLDKSSVDPTLTTNGVPADAAAAGRKLGFGRMPDWVSEATGYPEDIDSVILTNSYGNGAILPKGGGLIGVTIGEWDWYLTELDPVIGFRIYDSYGRDDTVMLPYSSGTLALESYQSFFKMLDDASTNQTVRASAGTKVMTLIDQPVSQKIESSVSSRLNTYIDGETGVEYVGKFYDGSLYYVPTGNVYPPNN